MSIERIEKSCGDVFAAHLPKLERRIRREVAREFAARRALPDKTCEIPWIGGEFNPHAPPEQLAALQQDVVRARVCQCWFKECEAPPWAAELPLSEEGIVALFNGPHSGNHRSWLVGEYGRMLRGSRWHREYVPTFDVFCAR